MGNASLASAYSGLADAYGLLPFNGGTPSEAYPKSNAAARKALELDSTLARPHDVESAKIAANARLQLFVRPKAASLGLQKGSPIMGTRQTASQSTDILSGWKNIAQHLGMGVRTVQRYERQLGLPVRRLAGRLRGAVAATKSELDAWVAASPIRETFQLAKPSSSSRSQELVIVKRGIEEMRVLRDQMVTLRDEMKDAVQVLANSIEILREDLREGNGETRHLSILDDDRQRHRLQGWMSMETKSRKAS